MTLTPVEHQSPNIITEHKKKKKKKPYVNPKWQA